MKITKPQIYDDLLRQCEGIGWIELPFIFAWEDFKEGLFRYDGATFVREHQNNYWEVAAFIHDWMNASGYVGKQPDLYFIKIMITLNYGENIIFERCKWMQWTWLNKVWHKVKGTFKSDDIPENLK